MYVEGREERKLCLQSRVNFLNKYQKTVRISQI